MYIEVPEKVTDQIEDGERLVGYMKNLFGEELYFTKLGCHTVGGCQNYLYSSERDYIKEAVSEMDTDDLDKYQKRFVSSFLWN